jgi:hypothetical protein
MARETSESSFDELARGLASGNITRGKVLKLMGAALLGGTLTSFGVGGVALADDECKPTGKKCRKTSSAAAASAKAASAPLRVHPTAQPAPPPMSAVAATALMGSARLVRLARSCATACAYSPVRGRMIAQEYAAALLPMFLMYPDIAVMPASWVPVQPTTTVLQGCFV